jgi:thioredoxin reductase (NADPH)
VELLRKKENVTILENTTVSAIHGTEGVTSVTLLHQGQEQSYPVEGVFVAVGTVPVGDWLADLHPTMEGGFVKADESGVTDVPGLFVAGDLRQKPLRQVITAAADGANAVTSAVQWLQNI